MTFTLPARRFGAEWVHELCTVQPGLEPGSQRWPSRGQVPVPARSTKLLRRA
jgi:isoamylase